MSSIGNKLVHPVTGKVESGWQEGISYRLWLIGQALANPSICWNNDGYPIDDLIEQNTGNIFKQVDSVIKKLDSEKQGG